MYLLPVDLLNALYLDIGPKYAVKQSGPLVRYPIFGGLSDNFKNGEIRTNSKLAG